MDRENKENDTDEDNMNEGDHMGVDEVVKVEVIGNDFWNDFGELLDDEDLN